MKKDRKTMALTVTVILAFVFACLFSACSDQGTAFPGSGNNSPWGDPFSDKPADQPGAPAGTSAVSGGTADTSSQPGGIADTSAQPGGIGDTSAQPGGSAGTSVPDSLGKSIDLLLSEYGISRVMIYDENIFGELLPQPERYVLNQYAYENNYIMDGLKDAYTGYTVGYTFHGSKEYEQQVLQELSDLFSESENYIQKRELRYAIGWLENDLNESRLTRITDYDASHTKQTRTDTEIKYDNRGNPVYWVKYRYERPDLTAEISYDDIGNVDKLIFTDYSQSEPETEIEYTYQYDERNMIRQVTVNEYIVSFDENGRFSSGESNNASYNDSFRIRFFYDEAGMISSIEDQNSAGEVTNEYTGEGLVMTWDDYYGPHAYAYDVNGNIVKYSDLGYGADHMIWEYDTRGNMISLDYPSYGEEHKYTWEYQDDRITGWRSDSASYAYEYNDAGRVLTYKESYTDQERMYRFTYDPSGITQVCNYYNDGELMDTLEYEYLTVSGRGGDHF